MRRFAHEILNWLQHEASVAVLVFDREGRLLEANEFVRRLLNGEVASQTLSEVFVDFHNELDIGTLAADPSAEHLLHLGHGSYLPQSLRFHFYRQDDVVLALGRPDAETAQALEQALQEISAELSNVNRELNKKNAELAWLNQQKNRFLGIAAHDLRSPLGHVLTCAGFLLEDGAEGLTPDRLEFLTIIRDSSRFMLGLIDDILDISAIEAGKLNLNMAPMDLARLVQENVELNHLLAAKRDLSLMLDKMEDIPPLEADAGKLRQVMNNLISNAIKFSPQGGRITVSLFASDRQAVVSVSDEGPGIPDQEVSKLFQPFSKTSVRPQSGEKSSGLGLSIAHRIVAGHGGRIWVNSLPNRGSTFYFSLPLQREEEQP